MKPREGTGGTATFMRGFRGQQTFVKFNRDPAVTWVTVIVPSVASLVVHQIHSYILHISFNRFNVTSLVVIVKYSSIRLATYSCALADEVGQN